MLLYRLQSRLSQTLDEKVAQRHSLQIGRMLKQSLQPRGNAGLQAVATVHAAPYCR